MPSSQDEVRARRSRHRTGSGLTVPRLLVHLLPVLFAAAPWLVPLGLVLLAEQEPGPLPGGEAWWPALIGASVAMLVLGVLVTAALRATLLGPVVRATDAARRAAEGDAAAWPELETASGAARDLGAALASALRTSDVLGGATRGLEELRQDVERLAEDARAMAAGDWTLRPEAPSEETAALADRLGALAERAGTLGCAAADLAAAVERATEQAWEESAPPDPSEDDLEDLATSAVAAASALSTELGQAHADATAAVAAASAEPEGTAEREAGVEAAQRLGLLALNAALEAGKLGPGASRFVAVAEELGREAERIRGALSLDHDAAAEEVPPLEALAATLEQLVEQARDLEPGLRQIEALARAAQEEQAATERAGPSWPQLIEGARRVRAELALVRIDGEESEDGGSGADPGVEA